MFLNGIYYMCPIMLSDSFNGFFNGAIRGLGLQFEASIFCLIIFYVFATPSGIIMAFVFDFGFKGLLGGFMIGTLMQVSSYFSLIVCADWNKIALKIVEDYKKTESMNKTINENNND